MTRKRKTFVPGRKPPKARKTYVVSYLTESGYLKQIYCPTYIEAKKEAGRLGKKGYKHRHVSYWIDGAEALRLARLGYQYDPKKKKAVKMKHYPRKFLKTIDSMDPERRDELYLDYRKFRTSDDVISHYQTKKKGGRN